MRAIFVILTAVMMLHACNNGAKASLPPAGSEGIDLSHNNGEVDWDALEADAPDFIYLKATEGRDWKDPLFQSHWREATQRGYRVGAYHFYLLCKDGEAQAQNFIQSVEVRAGTLSPAVDLEYAENCTPNASPADTIASLQSFLDLLEAEYGQRPVIYTTQTFHRDWIVGQFDTYPLWLRNLERAPDLPCAIWQYDMRGTIPGITGNVDRNRVAPPAHK